MSFKGSNIFITGINGFVGSVAAEYFLNGGAHVIGLVKDRNKKTRLDILDRCSIVYGDIQDKGVLDYILSKYEVDYVLHLAAQPIVRICNNDPFMAYSTNVMGTVNLLESCRTKIVKPKKIIVMTSDKAYGPHEKLPYVEDSPLTTFDSYCTSKSCQDMVARSYAMTYDLPVVVVRAGNLYGPGDLNTSRLIPRSIIRLLGGQSPVLYGGVDEYIREFIYVDDVVSAYCTLLEKGDNGQAYNVGGSTPQKIGEVIFKIRDLINSEIEVKVEKSGFSEINAQYLDASKLEKLGWSISIDLDEGLTRSIKWYSEYLNSGGVSCL